jgi:uncharacterized protein YhdP
MQDNIALESARFSLEGWMTLKKACGQRRCLAEKGAPAGRAKNVRISSPSIT